MYTYIINSILLKMSVIYYIDNINTKKLLFIPQQQPALLPEPMTDSNTYFERGLLKTNLLILHFPVCAADCHSWGAAPAWGGCTLQPCPPAAPALSWAARLNWEELLEVNKLGLGRDPKLIFNFVLSSCLSWSS